MKIIAAIAAFVAIAFAGENGYEARPAYDIKPEYHAPAPKYEAPKYEAPKAYVAPKPYIAPKPYVAPAYQAPVQAAPA
ncbi:hypothetical protein LPJ70_004962, partial [Coemansia sp. RSA 2708]